ncbi:MAG: CDP-alcohol phosphatidyltransferase family protein [Planctomycetota bacterium]
MGVSFRQLRETCQAPVRHGNDVAGLLFGDWASLPLTKLFVDLRLSPNIATISFLLCGLIGSAAQLGSARWAAAGAVLLVLYYVFDCVDGEVARWQGVEDMRWGYFDYIFHMLVKPCVFLAVAMGCFFELHEPWLLIAGAVAAVAVLWLKLFLEIPGILFMKGVLSGAPGGSRAFRRFLDSLQPSGGPALGPAGGAGHGGPASSSGEAARAESSTMRLRADLVTLRALLTNFDVGLVLLVVATLVDLAGVQVPPLLGFPLNARAVWLLFYAVNLPLNFLDYLLTYVRRGHFARETQRLLLLAHHYRHEDSRFGTNRGPDADSGAGPGAGRDTGTKPGAP